MRERLPEITFLVTLLKNNYESNKITTFSEMNNVVPDILSTVNLGRLRSAIKILRDDYGYVFRNVHSVGYEPVDNSKLAGEVSQKRNNRIKSQAKLYSRELGTVQTNKLTGEELLIYNKALLKSSVYQSITSDAFDMKCTTIANKCENSNRVVFTKETVKDAFKALAL